MYDVTDAEYTILEEYEVLALILGCSQPFDKQVLGIDTTDTDNSDDSDAEVFDQGADRDNDGFGDLVDCDDSNPNINPDAVDYSNDGVIKTVMVLMKTVCAQTPVTFHQMVNVMTVALAPLMMSVSWERTVQIVARVKTTIWIHFTT